MNGYNGEHYRDTTAQRAIQRVEREERERIKAAIAEVRRVLWLRGFELESRVILVDTKTGRIFK